MRVYDSMSPSAPLRSVAMSSSASGSPDDDEEIATNQGPYSGVSGDADTTPDTDGGVADPRSPGNASTDQPMDGCPAEMARIGDYGIDRYEAYVVEIDDAGVEQRSAPQSDRRRTSAPRTSRRTTITRPASAAAKSRSDRARLDPIALPVNAPRDASPRHAGCAIFEVSCTPAKRS
jgi:hypothetical protein